MRKINPAASDDRPTQLRSTRMRSRRKGGPSAEKGKEEFCVEGGKVNLEDFYDEGGKVNLEKLYVDGDKLSVRERRKLVVQEAQETLKSWELSASLRDLAKKSSSDVDKQEEGKLKKRKTPEERPRFTYQERWAYKRRLKQSKGFDVGDVPENVDPRLTPIAPYKFVDGLDADIRLKRVERYSKIALDKYNKDNKIKFEFQKCLKANVTTYSCRLWYLTFQSKHMPGFRPKNFQAIVHTNEYDEVDVKHCKRVT